MANQNKPIQQASTRADSNQDTASPNTDRLREFLWRLYGGDEVEVGEMDEIVEIIERNLHSPKGSAQLKGLLNKFLGDKTADTSQESAGEKATAKKPEAQGWLQWLQKDLANRLFEYLGCPSDPEEGLKHLLQTAEKDNEFARFALVNRLIDGRGCRADQLRGMRLLRRYAEQGERWAQIELADRLIDGRGCQADPKLGMSLLYRFAENGTRWLREDLIERLLDDVKAALDPEKTASRSSRIFTDQAVEDLEKKKVEFSELPLFDFSALLPQLN
ncbi:MAG: sel1 repeat family protein [Thermoguttaceae bacterium]|nr:sel1 repeat family protein [Thermoguttaceae bacterium]